MPLVAVLLLGLAACAAPPEEAVPPADEENPRAGMIGPGNPRERGG